MDQFITPDDIHYSERALSLVSIGRDAIARADDVALNHYFADDYVLHGPRGDIDKTGVKTFFAVMRAAFDDFACERLTLIEQGDTIAAHTVMSGIFTAPLEGTAAGTIPPNGKPMQRELLNLFRFDADGRLAEEWVQYDDLTFLGQLGVEMVAAD